MTALKLISTLESRGVKLEAVAGKLNCHGVRGVLTDADRADLTRLKPEILALLSTTAPPAPAPTWEEELRTPEVTNTLATMFVRPPKALSIEILCHLYPAVCACGAELPTGNNYRCHACVEMARVRAGGIP